MDPTTTTVTSVSSCATFSAGSEGAPLHTHRGAPARADRHATAAPSRDEEDVHRVMNELFAGYEQTELVPGQSYEIRNMSVPVFGPNGEAVIRFTIYGFPHTCTCAEVDAYVARVRDAARSATAALGGREPDVVDAPATDLGDRRDR
jgi:hypothetical protein